MKKTKNLISVVLACLALFSCFSVVSFAATPIRSVSIVISSPLVAGTRITNSFLTCRTTGAGISSLKTEVLTNSTWIETTEPFEVKKQYRLTIEVETKGAYTFPEMAVSANLTVNGKTIDAGVLWRSTYHISVTYIFSVEKRVLNAVNISIPTPSIGSYPPYFSEVSTFSSVKIITLLSNNSRVEMFIKKDGRWEKTTDRIEPGKLYRYYLRFAPESESYVFVENRALFSASINGKNAAFGSLTSSYVELFYDFQFIDWNRVLDSKEGLKNGDWYIDWDSMKADNKIDDQTISYRQEMQRLYIDAEGSVIKIETKQGSIWEESVFSSETDTYKEYKPYIKQFKDTLPTENNSKESEALDNNGDSICLWCGKTHVGFFQKIIAFFHNILIKIVGPKYEG